MFCKNSEDYLPNMCVISVKWENMLSELRGRRNWECKYYMYWW